MLAQQLFPILVTFTLFSQSTKTDESYLEIAGYRYTLPTWWHSVTVDIPDNVTNDVEVRDYVTTKYGSDVGTAENWKSALKVHALLAKKIDRLPLYVGHCLMTGKQYQEAASVYEGLYKAARIRKIEKPEREWYECYSLYSAGRAYKLSSNLEKSREMFKKASEYIPGENKGVNTHAEAVKYYAQLAKEELEEINK